MLKSEINENTVNGAAPEIAVVDRKLTIQDIYSQLKVPSLGREIFPVYEQNGPLAGVFALEKVNDKVKLLRADSQVYDSEPINTGITQEAVQDIEAQFGLSANRIIASLLRVLANEQENIKTKEFLEAHATQGNANTLSEPGNSKLIVEEISQAVAEHVMEINSGGYIAYKSSAVIPARFAGAFAIRGDDVNDDSESLFYMATVGHTKYYLDPDPTNKNTVYVSLNSEGSSSAVFREYTDDIVTATDPDTGNKNFFIFNRFAITASPKHEIHSMIYKFDVS